MDGFARAEQLTAHIGDPSRRSEVRNNLTKFFAALEAIPDDDEAVYMDQEDQRYRDDGSDGIPITTVCELGSKERERLDNLRDLHEDMKRESAVTKQQNDVVTVEVVPDVNEAGKRGLTPLHRAVMAEDLDECVSLRERGARADIPDWSGFTALDRAKFRAEDSETAKKIADLLQSW